MGILLSFGAAWTQALRPDPAGVLVMSVLMDFSLAATAALSAGRREVGVMAEVGRKDNSGP
ncbi:MAG: hypothetical protein J0H89_06680 [Rhizobiales bacterium]|nr:hypothetical protein [Hyphomicrobiales bacterium]